MTSDHENLFSRFHSHVNICGKFHWNPSTNYRDIVSREIAVSRWTDSRMAYIMPLPCIVGRGIKTNATEKVDDWRSMGRKKHGDHGQQVSRTTGRRWTWQHKTELLIRQVAHDPQEQQCVKMKRNCHNHSFIPTFVATHLHSVDNRYLLIAEAAQRADVCSCQWMQPHVLVHCWCK